MWDEPWDLIVSYTDALQGIRTASRFFVFTEDGDEAAAEWIAELHMKCLLDLAGVPWR